MPRGRAGLQHRELTAEDYEELGRLDEGPKGANKQQIDAGSIKAKLKEDKEEDCVICMEPMKKNTLARTLPCMHAFHSRCVDKWLKSNNSCPICKHKLE